MNSLNIQQIKLINQLKKKYKKLRKSQKKGLKEETRVL